MLSRPHAITLRAREAEAARLRLGLVADWLPEPLTQVVGRYRVVGTHERLGLVACITTVLSQFDLH